MGLDNTYPAVQVMTGHCCGVGSRGGTRVDVLVPRRKAFGGARVVQQQ